MKSTLFGALFGAAVAIGPLSAQATVINFDVDGLGAPIAAGTAITNQYAALGVLFRGLENGVEVDLRAAQDQDGGAEPSSPNVLTNCASAGGGLFCPGNRADIVQIDFASAVEDVSLQLNTLGGQSVTFNLFDDLNNVLETQTVTSAGSLFVALSFSATGIRRIEGLQPNDGWAWEIDDLTFSQVTAVPAPAPLLLLGTGLFGFALFGRRKSA